MFIVMLLNYEKSYWYKELKRKFQDFFYQFCYVYQFLNQDFVFILFLIKIQLQFIDVKREQDIVGIDEGNCIVKSFGLQW